jgi:hypothetical protein
VIEKWEENRPATQGIILCQVRDPLYSGFFQHRPYLCMWDDPPSILDHGFDGTLTPIKPFLLIEIVCTTEQDFGKL